MVLLYFIIFYINSETIYNYFYNHMWNYVVSKKSEMCCIV